MTQRSAARLAWVLWFVSLVCVIAGTTLTVVSPATTGEPPPIVLVASVLAFGTVGGLIAGRRRNPIGWLFLAIAVAFPLGFAAERYALMSLVDAGHPLPGTVVAALVSSLLPPVAAISFPPVFLLFPTGTLPGPRWRVVGRAMACGVVLVLVGWGLRPGPLNGPWNDRDIHVTNPLGVPPLAAPLGALFAAGVALSLLTAACGVAGLVLRFRRARGAEREQVKWLAYVGLACALIFASSIVTSVALGEDSLPGNIAWNVFFILLVVGIPVSAGFAILRYRLYDIDRIITRTISYAVVTGLLIAVYVGLVVLFQSVTRPLTGSSDLAVAASTLLVAAAFVPVRRRVQSMVDRRFNRSRYDAAHIIDAFTTRLRDEVDIDALGAELREVVDRTMRPAHVSIWMAGHP